MIPRKYFKETTLMLCYRTFRLLCILCLLGLTFSLPASAQDDPAFTTASQAYSSYHGGDIDHVDLFSGNLSIDIPLMSYPQKGGKLGLNFALHYQSGPATRSPAIALFRAPYRLSTSLSISFFPLQMAALTLRPWVGGQ